MMEESTAAKWDFLLEEKKVYLCVADHKLTSEDGSPLIVVEIGHGRSGMDLWVKFQGVKSGKNLNIRNFDGRSEFGKTLSSKSVANLIEGLLRSCPWIEKQRRKRKAQNETENVRKEKYILNESTVEVTHQMENLAAPPYKDKLISRIMVNVLTLMEPPERYRAREINIQWVDMIKKKIRGQPNFIATVLPVLVDPDEVKSILDFDFEKLHTYKLYTLGGNHLRTALQQISKESNLNDIRNVNVHVYVGLTPEEGLEIANIHNGMMSTLKPTFQDCVKQARKLYQTDQAQTKSVLAEKVAKMLSDIEMKEVQKESVGACVSVATYSEENFGICLDIFSTYQHKYGMSKSIPQALFKELQGIKDAERGPYLEEALKTNVALSLKKLQKDRKRAKLESCFVQLSNYDTIQECREYHGDYMEGIDQFLDLEIKKNTVPDIFIKFCKDAADHSQPATSSCPSQTTVSIDIKMNGQAVPQNKAITNMINNFKNKITNYIRKNEARLSNVDGHKNSVQNDSGIDENLTYSEMDTQPPENILNSCETEINESEFDTSKDLFN